MSGVLAEVAADTEANAGRALSGWRPLAYLLASRSAQAVALHRVARRLHLSGHRVAALVVNRISQSVYTVDIDPRASIGPRFTLRHAFCVVIGAEAVIGERCVLFHGVTLGKRLSGGPDRPDGMPRLGDRVLVGAGSTLLGPIAIGDDALVGAGVVLTRSVSSGARVLAPPPKVVEPS